jgi:hypothetical protein
MTMKRGLLLLLVLAPLTGCAAAQAKTPIERPNLEVPPPPPRVIEPVTPVEVPPPDPVGDLPASPATPRQRPASQREPAKPAESPRTDPVVEQPAVTPPPATPPLPPLRTPSAPDAAVQVRQIIDRATGTLNSIDYRALSQGQRAQYDNAKLLIKQAEDAVKASNFDFGRNLADKAERIAKELQGR